MTAALMPIPQTAPGSFYPGLGRIYRDSRFDVILTAVFTAGTETLNLSFAIQNDAHFLCVETTYTNSLVLAAAGALPPTIAQGGAFIQLTDGRTQKPLSNAQVPTDCLFGTAREPFVWPIPHVFAANSPLVATVTGIGAAMAGATIRYVFSGYKVPLGSGPWEQA